MERLLGDLRQSAQRKSRKIVFLWPGTLPEGTSTHIETIILQFTILSHKSSIVKGFLQNILDFFVFDENRQKTLPHGLPGKETH